MPICQRGTMNDQWCQLFKKEKKGKKKRKKKKKRNSEIDEIYEK